MHLAMQASLSPQVLLSVALANDAVVLASPVQPDALAVVAEAFEAQVDAQLEALTFVAEALEDEHPEALAVVAEAFDAHSDEPALAVVTLASPWQEPSATILA